MPLRFKLDENIPGRALSTLRAQGHDVETAETEGLAGAADPMILAACVNEERILVTLDLDFAVWCFNRQRSRWLQCLAGHRADGPRRGSRPFQSKATAVGTR